MNIKDTMAAVKRRLGAYEDKVLEVSGHDFPIIEAQKQRELLLDFIEKKLCEAMLCSPSGRAMYE